MDPAHPSSSRYQPIPDASAATIPSLANLSGSSSSSQRSLTPISARRRHSQSQTDDGLEDVESKRRGLDEDDDEEDGALELDEFLPSGRPSRRANGLAAEDDDDDGHHKGPDDGLDPSDPLTLVKRAVPETDDPTLPALTLRAVMIGSFFAVLGAAVAQVSGRYTKRVRLSVGRRC
jgi:hypothetical protein